MNLKGQFWLLTSLLLVILAAITYYVFYNSSQFLFIGVEALIFIVLIYLFVFYNKIIKPLQIIGSGMDLLREQDFGSRLRNVGQPEADRIVDVFNKMMEQLKNERLHLREQNHFLDLLIEASPLGVIILDLDDRIQSINPAACKIFEFTDLESIKGQLLSSINTPLGAELMRLNVNETQTIRLSDANVYKCTYSFFVDKGFHHPFFLVESLTEEVFKVEKKAYEKVIRMISHEVNNTTAGITSMLDTLDSAFTGMENMDDICDILHISADRCRSLSQFITNFADVVRIPEPQLVEQNLNSLVFDSKRFMESLCHDLNIEMKLELCEVSPVVKVDNSLFEQVLLNIIKNAAESIGKDGIIYIRTIQKPICLEIADTGKGINEEVSGKLFSPFFSTKPNGQGLGLIFIREVLQKHGCKFSLSTYSDGLTRFRIFFS